MSAGIFLRLDWRGDELLGDIQGRVRVALAATLADTAAAAAARAPVDTGALRNSITFQVPFDTVGYVGSWTIEYALYQEVGTYKMAAQPYLRPAADAIFPTILRRLAAT